MDSQEHENPDIISKIIILTEKATQNFIVSRMVKDNSALFSSLYALLCHHLPPREIKKFEINEQSRTALQNLQKDLARNQKQISNAYLSNFYQGAMLFEKYFYENNWKEWEEWSQEAYLDAKASYAEQINTFEKNIDDISQLLELNPSEKEVLDFQVLKQSSLEAQLFYNNLFMVMENPYLGKVLMTEMFGAEIGSLYNKNNPLVLSGILKLNKAGIPMPMTESIFKIFDNHTLEEHGVFSPLFKKLEKKPSYFGALGTISEKDQNICLSLFNSINAKAKKEQGENKSNFKKTSNQVGQVGINILAYGNKQIDKINTIQEIFKNNSYEVYSLETKEIPRQDLATRLFLVQRYLKQHFDATKTILLIEEAGAILRKNQQAFYFFQPEDMPNEDDEEHYLDDLLLIKNPIPSIWLVNSPSELVEENVGRFLFHLEIKPASRSTRKEQVAKIIKELNLSSDLEEYISKYSHLSFNQIQSATVLAKMIGGVPQEQEDLIKHGILQSQIALKRNKMEDLRDSVTTYSLDYINVKGAFKPDRIMEALKKSGAGTVCLYGIPGAGKTQFAEYLALQLDKPIIMKRASDILSKWLGENEKNIANMFLQAKQEEAILFLDEADSFLRDRAEAKAEWSVSQVNELLQQMERHEGIFICATNLFQAIDAAALRRFTFKLEFVALNSEQRWKMFKHEAQIDVLNLNEEQHSNLKKRLDLIQNLAPGDFSTVKRQSNILGTAFSPEEWLVQLEQEAKDKLNGLMKQKMGF